MVSPKMYGEITTSDGIVHLYRRIHYYRLYRNLTAEGARVVVAE